MNNNAVTDDFKSNLLDYFVGNMTREEGYEDPDWVYYGPVNKNVKKDITDGLAEQLSDTINDVLVLGKIHDESLNKWLVYGIYAVGLEPNLDYHGYIYIMDENLNQISLLTSFESGTSIYPITALNKDENNDYYGLTLDYDTSKTRVILLNNILASGSLTGRYVIKLNASYFTPTNYSLSLFRQNRITKVNGQSIYYIVHHENNKTIITKLQINVGSENKWDDIQLNELLDTAIFDTSISVDSNTSTFHLYSTTILEDTDKYIEYAIVDTTASKVKSINLPSNATSTSFLSQVLVKDINNIYIAFPDSNNLKTFIYKVDGNNLINLYESNDWVQEEAGYLPVIISMQNINNVIFLKKTNRGILENAVSIGNLIDDKVYLTLSHNDDTGWNFYDYVQFYILNVYNLYYIYDPILAGEGNRSTLFTLIYNENNYSGMKYTNINSMVPQYVSLYNSDNDPIFARNLYNKTINNNTTQASIQVPNNYLNDVVIDQENLMSATNSTIINNYTEITKNIYESLLINFYNTLNITNSNDTSNPISNLLGAIRLNQSISNTVDYDNVQATKLKINYDDNTYSIRNLTINSGFSYIDEKSGEYDIVLYVPENKSINNVQIISNDELTIYHEISCSSLEKGKTYKLTQKIEVM